MRKLLLAAVAGLLAACATATPYQPASSGSYGFSEQRIEDNRMRITFRGNSATDRETVETYLLYRSAELTLQNGHDYFVVIERDTESHTRLQNLGPSHYSGFFYNQRYFYRGYWSPWYDPFYDPFGPDYREVTRYEAVAEITMHDGAKPDDPHAFDAREVQANLQGRIVRPPAG